MTSWSQVATRATAYQSCLLIAVIWFWDSWRSTRKQFVLFSRKYKYFWGVIQKIFLRPHLGKIRPKAHHFIWKSVLMRDGRCGNCEKNPPLGLPVTVVWIRINPCSLDSRKCGETFVYSCLTVWTSAGTMVTSRKDRRDGQMLPRNKNKMLFAGSTEKWVKRN